MKRLRWFLNLFQRRPRILMVCAGNTCRSPIAAALAQKMLGSRYVIESAGVEAVNGQPAAWNAIKVMQENGRDISEHHSRSLPRNLSYDLIVLFSGRLLEALVAAGAPKKRVIVLEVSDPIGQSISVYRRTAAEIKSRLADLFASRGWK